MRYALFAFALAIAATPTKSFAHSTKHSIVKDSLDAAFKKFETEEIDSIKQFIGIKGWLEADITKVKIYLKDRATVLYSCEMIHQDTQEIFNCKKL